MRKSRVYKKHSVQPDPVYNDVRVGKFVNHLMRDGEKLVAFKVFYKAMDIIEEKTKEKGIDVFSKAIENVAPSIEIKKRRVGGSTSQVSVDIRPCRAEFLAMTFLIKCALKRSEKTMPVKLANEMISAHNGEGEAVKKKEEIHKMANSNKTSFIPSKNK